jgi:hypothetical protein
MRFDLAHLINPERLRPIDIAKVTHDLLNTSDETFEEELAEYMRNGFVVASHVYFMMGRLCNIAEEGEPEEIAWFIRFAYGDLRLLFNMLPAWLPKICFYRAKLGKDIDPKLHVWDLDRIRHLAFVTKKKNK